MSYLVLFFFCRSRGTRPDEPDKVVARAAPPPAVEVMNQRDHGVVASRSVAPMSEIYRPSPELQPMSPLNKAPIRRTPIPAIFSDEETTSYYSPHNTSGTLASEYAPTPHNNNHVAAAAAASSLPAVMPSPPTLSLALSSAQAAQSPPSDSRAASPSLKVSSPTTTPSSCLPRRAPRLVIVERGEGAQIVCKAWFVCLCITYWFICTFVFGWFDACTRCLMK